MLIHNDRKPISGCLGPCAGERMDCKWTQGIFSYILYLDYGSSCIDVYTGQTHQTVDLKWVHLLHMNYTLIEVNRALKIFLHLTRNLFNHLEK